MANGRYINIDFPFKNSPKGFFLNLNPCRTSNPYSNAESAVTFCLFE